jgi:hypothetical protein
MAEPTPPVIPLDLYRTIRTWAGRWLVIILNDTPTPPVMHLPGEYLGMDGTDPVYQTVCGRKRAARSMTWLPYRYARLFCRPCHRCAGRAGEAW